MLIVFLLSVFACTAWAITPVTQYQVKGGAVYATEEEARYAEAIQPIKEKMRKAFRSPIWFAIEGCPPVDEDSMADFILTNFPPNHCIACHGDCLTVY